MVIENSQYYFYISNGNVARDLSELLSQLKTMDDSTYGYHVNQDKNDFSNWIKYVIKDHLLANKVLKSKNRKEMIKLIDQAIKSSKTKKHLDKKQIISKIMEAYSND